MFKLALDSVQIRPEKAPWINKNHFNKWFLFIFTINYVRGNARYGARLIKKSNVLCTVGLIGVYDTCYPLLPIIFALTETGQRP